MVADSAVFISHKPSGTIPDHREPASAMIADELRYMKTRLKVVMYRQSLPISSATIVDESVALVFINRNRNRNRNRNCCCAVVLGG